MCSYKCQGFSKGQTLFFTADRKLKRQVVSTLSAELVPVMGHLIQRTATFWLSFHQHVQDTTPSLVMFGIFFSGRALAGILG